jgi:hypothetical protein
MDIEKIGTLIAVRFFFTSLIFDFEEAETNLC